MRSWGVSSAVFEDSSDTRHMDDGTTEAHNSTYQRQFLTEGWLHKAGGVGRAL